MTCLVLLFLTWGFTPQMAEAREVELTFDDGPDGSGTSDGQVELDNLEDKLSDVGVDPVAAVFTGVANRSAITEGRYGRAADFPGGLGALELSPWPSRNEVAVYLWLKPRNTNAGTIVSHEGSWAVRFVAGELVVDAYRGPADRVTIASGVQWPVDGQFHHLFIAFDASGATPRFLIAVDQSAPVMQEIPFVPERSVSPLRLATNYDGLLDELLITGDSTPGPGELLNRLPTACEGTTCVEEVITMQPRDFAYEVPVRYKTAWDDTTCTATSPCPLLFAISGGAKCADDYQSVRPFVDAGFIVVTVDMFCAANGSTSHYPQETSQLVAVKEAVLATGATHRDLIAGNEYVASGCSHGGRTVLLWALRETDYPARTYARAGVNSGLCGLLAGAYCPAVEEDRFALLGGAFDVEDPAVRAFHESQDLVGMPTAEIVASREIARSWGVNLSGPMCNADGTHACTEQGLRDAT